MDIGYMHHEAPVLPQPLLAILGPLRLHGDAGAIGLGGSRPRRLLAALAVHEGEILSLDRLIDDIWGEAPPATAKQNVHTYVWSLRQSLSSAAPGRLLIEAQFPGYRLVAAPGELDWQRFGELTTAATRHQPTAPEVAGKLLREALDLWRGSPVADVADDLPSLSGRIAAMEEARIAALEQRIEADLWAGLERELVAELAGLVAAHPLREQLRRLQMIALHRCGRTAEALLAFHSFRGELAAELGVEPSSRLCALFQAMLRNTPVSSCAMRGQLPELEMIADGAKARDVTCDTIRSETRLGQLAASEEARAFQGRTDELRRVLQLMAASDQLPRVLRLYGPAGIGKTAFAHELARMCTSQDWRAVILDSRDFRHDAASLSETLAARCAFGDGERSRPRLLVFDTFEEMADVERDLWEIILPGVAGTTLVILSGRHRAAIPTTGCWEPLVSDLELSGLSAADSLQLARRHGICDPATITRIVEFAAGNPLLLTVAAQHAQQGKPGAADLPGTVARSVLGQMTREIAGPEMRELLEAASVVRTFNQELLEAMLGRDVTGSFPALCRLSFVRVTAHGARLHDLVRETVAADLRWRTPQALQELRSRACGYVARLAEMSPDPGPWLAELLHLAATTSHRARFYTRADHPHVHVRPARPEDLPRLGELCHIGISRYGLPPAARARQLDADFAVARPFVFVALDDTGLLTGFLYYIRLNNVSWRAAARTREAFFAALPEPEMAMIRTASETALTAILVAGATHLPEHDHVNTALEQASFATGRQNQAGCSRLTAYHLLSGPCPALPTVISMGLRKRATDIDLGGFLADEWLLTLDERGYGGWVADLVGAEAAPHGVGTVPGTGLPQSTERVYLGSS